MTTPHSWTGLTIATPEGVGVYVRCSACALVVPVTHLAQWQGRGCHVAGARAALEELLRQARAEGILPPEDDAATVAAFLASL